LLPLRVALRELRPARKRPGHDPKPKKDGIPENELCPIACHRTRCPSTTRVLEKDIWVLFNGAEIAPGKNTASARAGSAWPRDVQGSQGQPMKTSSGGRSRTCVEHFHAKCQQSVHHLRRLTNSKLGKPRFRLLGRPKCTTRDSLVVRCRRFAPRLMSAATRVCSSDLSLALHSSISDFEVSGRSAGSPDPHRGPP